MHLRYQHIEKLNVLIFNNAQCGTLLLFFTIVNSFKADMSLKLQHSGQLCFYIH